MIRVSALYPNTPDVKFDWDYYLKNHIPAVRKLAPMGLIRIEVDRGIASAQPGAPAPFVCVAHMYFNNVEDMQKCMAAIPPELMADGVNFTNAQAQSQVSEMI